MTDATTGPPLGNVSLTQLKMLRDIVRTNGGGINSSKLNGLTLGALYRRGLVQGKSGSGWIVVHTRDGLDLIRRLDAEARP